jgi:hypothetical protein
MCTLCCDGIVSLSYEYCSSIHVKFCAWMDLELWLRSRRKAGSGAGSDGFSNSLMTSITFIYKLNIYKYTPHRILGKHMQAVGQEAWEHSVTPASDDPTGRTVGLISLTACTKDRTTFAHQCSECWHYSEIRPRGIFPYLIVELSEQIRISCFELTMFIIFLNSRRSQLTNYCNEIRTRQIYRAQWLTSRQNLLHGVSLLCDITVWKCSVVAICLETKRVFS